MKQLQGSGVICSAAAMLFMAAAPVWAQTTQITGVQLNPSDGGVNVILRTSAGERPQIFTTKRGNALVADIINTQLRLPEGNSYSQDNPAPGIASVSITQLDPNSVRLVVTGSGSAPTSQPVVRRGEGITLAFTAAGGTQAETPAPQATPPTPQAQVPGQPPAGATPGSTQPGQAPGVLVPNPQITIDGQPAPAAPIAPVVTPGPPFLPRAVAPPVGDIAISNLNAAPAAIDLGTAEVVPRLVLRDAPVREVLALLARAAGLNLAFTAPQAAGPGQPPGLPPGVPGAAANEGPTISLDVENESVQDVFNYVLRLTGLEANRTGRTIFVGTNLPNAARDVVTRSLRLNQVTVGEALNFLVGLGAESAVSRERLVTTVNAVPVTGAGGASPAVTQSQTTTEQRLEVQRVQFQDVEPILRGLLALGDERTNSVTLIGTPRQIDLATAQLSRLDIRRRQVAVNVKVVDINLLATDQFNTSFSFGIVDNLFFRSDAGTGIVNIGGRSPVAADAGPNPGGILNFPQRFLAQLTATINNGNAKILTDPTLVVQEGQNAVVALTQEVIGDTETTVTTGDNPIFTVDVEKEDVGLTLNIAVERIDDNGFVSLSVAPVVSAPVDEELITLGPTGGQQRIVLIAERRLESGLIRVRDGQTLILSGIIQDADRVEVNKVPILGDLPLIGALFRRTNRTNQRQEVVVLLTPQIIGDAEATGGFGYNYTPTPEVRELLERRGLQLPASTPRQ